MNNQSNFQHFINSTVQETPAWQLLASSAITAHGIKFRLMGLVPVANKPEFHERFSGVFTRQELCNLRDHLDQVLADNGSSD